MDDANSLSKLEIGVLEELINISFGLSASLVEKMLEVPIVLHVPRIKIMDTKELNSFLRAAQPDDESFLYVTKQLFKGELSGEIVFSITQDEATNFTKFLHKIEGSEATKSLIEGSLLELTNIMASSCVGQLSEMMQSKVHFVEPHLMLIDETNVITLEESNRYDKIITMKTVLDLEDKSIKGNMYILIGSASFSMLKDSLNKMLG